MAGAITLERVIEKVRELESRVRALERAEESSRAIDDIRSSLAMIADKVHVNDESSSATTAANATRNSASPLQHQHKKAKNNAGKKDKSKGSAGALSDIRFRVI